MTSVNCSATEAALASALVHLLEHIDTGEVADAVAARSALSHPVVQERLRELRAAALLPVRRDGKPPVPGL